MCLDIYGSIMEDDKNNTYVFGLHQYALYYWLNAQRKKKILPKAQLIHIDYHTDFLTPLTDIASTITPAEVRQLIESKKIQNDTFIKSAINLGLIDNITFCCPPARHQPTGNFKNYYTPIALRDNLSACLNNKHAGFTHSELFSNLNSANIILDIDLDFFYRPTGRKAGLKPKSEKDIKKEVCAINCLQKYATVTTIATSPEMYRKEYRDFVESIFSRHFVVPIDFNGPLAIKD